MAFNLGEFMGVGQQPQEKENNPALDALGQSLLSPQDKSLGTAIVGGSAAKGVTGSTGISNPTNASGSSEDDALLMALI